MTAPEEATSSRPKVQAIYARVMEDAHDELERPSRALGFSGLFAGFTIGATPLAVATALAVLGGGEEEFIAALLYPVGFIAVIIGRAQLFTENTLYPVLATFDEPRFLGATLRLWAVVLAANLLGGAVFALIAMETSALPDAAVAELGKLGREAAAGGFWETFWSGVLAGWLLALVAWLVEAAEGAIGQLLLVWVAVLPIGLVPLDHCVATAVEVFAGTLAGEVQVDKLIGWLATATLGNVLGGIFIVSVLNYGQVTSGGASEPKD